MNMNWITNIAALALLSMSGCSTTTTTTLFDSPPKSLAFSNTPQAGRVTQINLGAGTSARSVASRLKALGFRSIDTESGVVTAATTNPEFVDCGTISQTAFGNRARFDGTAPLSVIYTDQNTGAFMAREFSVETHVQVRVEGRKAWVTESHDVEIAWVDPNSRRRAKQKITVTTGSLAKFADGTICSTSNRIAKQLR